MQTWGAVLFRDFELADPHTFAAAATTIGGPLGEHYEGPSPRSPVAPGVYTASEVAPPLVVPEHAEMSYLPRMCRHLFFWCRSPARRGGATTLVDGRRLLARLDEAHVEPLMRHGLLIRRRHAGPRGRRGPLELKPWPQMFGTANREQLVAQARALSFAICFEPDGAVTFEHEQPAVRTHPQSGERAWLNHLLVFHASAPAALLRSAAAREHQLTAAALYPFALAYRRLARWCDHEVASDVRLSSGEGISDACVAHVREVVARQRFSVDWQRGDLLAVDNHLMMHGRRPFRGARELLVAWSNAHA